MTTRYLAVLLAVAIFGAVTVAAYDEARGDGSRAWEAYASRFAESGGTKSASGTHPLLDPRTLPASPGQDEKVGAAPEPTAEDALVPRSDEPRIHRGTDGAELLRLASRNLSDAPYKATYDLSGNDPGLGALTGTLTVASQQPKEYLGVSGKLGNTDGSFIAIHQGDANFLCIKGQGDSACLKTGANEASPLALPRVLELQNLVDQLANQPDASLREVGGQRIAGRDGRCFEVGAQPGNGLVCVAETDTALLLVDGHFHGADFELRLKDFTPDPTDADFEPPFPVTELP